MEDNVLEYMPRQSLNICTAYDVQIQGDRVKE